MIGQRIVNAMFGALGFMIVHAAIHYPDVVKLWDEVPPFSKEGIFIYLITFLGSFLLVGPTTKCQCKEEGSS